MNTKSLFKKYYRRAALLGLLKALLLSAIAGFIAVFLTAFALWFTHLKLAQILLISGLTFVGVTLLALPFVYFLFLRPTTAAIAKLIDNLGLEERMITMYELENDESYIAMLQREDAQKRLKNVSSKDIKTGKLPRLALIMLAVSFVFGASMVLVSSLASKGVARRGSEVFAPPDDEQDPDEEEEEKEYVNVDYSAGEGGMIEGEMHQRIEKGTDAEPVTATPLEGYVFVVWSDGILTAQRWDWSVMEDLAVEAQFELAPEKEEGDGQSGEEGEDGEDGEGGDEDSDDGESDGGDNEGDENGEKGDGEGDGSGEGDGPQGSGGPDGEGNTDDTEGSGGDSDGGDEEGGGPDRGDSHDDDIGSGSGASPGKNTDNNNIIDGKTDYHDAVDTEQNKQDLAEDGSIPPELKDILDGYFDSLNP